MPPKEGCSTQHAANPDMQISQTTQAAVSQVMMLILMQYEILEVSYRCVL